MPRPTAKKYAEIGKDNKVINLAACSEQVAKERGYIRAGEPVQIGDKYAEKLNAFTREVIVIDEQGEEHTELIVMPIPAE